MKQKWKPSLGAGAGAVLGAGYAGASMAGEIQANGSAYAIGAVAGAAIVGAIFGLLVVRFRNGRAR